MADGSGSFSPAPGSWSSALPLLILLGSGFTVWVCLSLGRMILRDACRDPGARFVVGGAALSLIVFAVCAAKIAYPAVLFGVGVLCLWGRRPRLPTRREARVARPGRPEAYPTKQRSLWQSRLKKAVGS